MKTLFHSYGSVRQAAFTKIELLVTIMVLAMLAGVAASASRGMSNQVKIAQCAGNLHQFALSHLLYASDYSDKLPAPPAPIGTWPWDLPWEIGIAMTRYGTPPPTMYCPGTAPRFTPAINAQLYQYGGPSFHVIGYITTIPGNSSLATSNINYTTIPQPIQFGPAILPPPSAAKRVLISDANLTSGGSYSSVFGGFALPHTCPHLNGVIPAGGNVAMLDGHVEWRPFSQMIVRTAAYPGPNFLW